MGLFSSSPRVAEPYAVQCVVKRGEGTTIYNWAKATVYQRPSVLDGSGILHVVGPFGSEEACDEFCRALMQVAQVTGPVKAAPKPAEPDDEEEEEEQEDEEASEEDLAEIRAKAGLPDQVVR